MARGEVIFDSYTDARCAGGIVMGDTSVNPGDCVHSTTSFASAQYRGHEFDNVEQPVAFYSDDGCRNEISGATVELGDGYNCFTVNGGAATSAKWLA